MRKRLLLCVLIIISLFLIGCDKPLAGKAGHMPAGGIAGAEFHLDSPDLDCIVKEITIDGQLKVISNCPQNNCLGGKQSASEFMQQNPGASNQMNEAVLSYGENANPDDMIVCPCKEDMFGDKGPGAMGESPKGAEAKPKIGNYDEKYAAGGADDSEFGDDLDADKVTEQVEEEIINRQVENDPDVQAADRELKKAQKEQDLAKENLEEANGWVKDASKEQRANKNTNTVKKYKWSKEQQKESQQDYKEARSNKFKKMGAADEARERAKQKYTQEMKEKKKDAVSNCPPEDTDCIDQATKDFLEGMIDFVNQFLPDNAKINKPKEKEGGTPMDWLIQLRNELSGEENKGDPGPKHIDIDDGCVRASEEAGRPGAEGNMGEPCPTDCPSDQININNCPSQERQGGLEQMNMGNRFNCGGIGGNVDPNVVNPKR